MSPRTFAPVVGFLVLAALAAGCSKSPTSPSSSIAGTGVLRVRMTDAPAALDAVNLVIVEVAAHRAEAGGWEVLNAHAATYDLLQLRNGVFTTIGLDTVPAGLYTQVRLKLGPGSNVVVDGIEHPLTVPSGVQTGLKLVGEFVVPAGGLLDVALDFDAARSVFQTGAGEWKLKPTVRVLPFSTAGAIHGTIAPAGTEAVIRAIHAPDTLATTSALPDGSFTLSLLPAGAYDVAIAPASGFRDTTLTGVAVTAGQTTEVGTVELTAQ